MTTVAEEIDGYRRDLREIVGRKTEVDIRAGLLDLANKVGACTHTPRANGFPKEQIEDLVQSINGTLQTWAMIDACRTAAKNQRTAVIAAIIALVSTLAAWAAVVAYIVAAKP
jgi:hypothetical protein